MTSSSRNEPKDITRYAVAASKGLAYWLPKSAQSHLQSLLKQLPSTARSIYKEQYRDVMCGKACAAASVVAMADFVLQFPKCAKMHNAFAREMNAEIESDEREGYEPVFFPIVDESESEAERYGEVDEVQECGSGKRLYALDDAGTSEKKVKNDQGSLSATPPRSDTSDNPLLTSNTQDSETPGLLSHSVLPPSYNSPSEEGAVSQECPFQGEDSQTLLTTEDVDHRVTRLSVTEDPISRSLSTQAAPPSPPTRQPIVPSNYHALQDSPQLQSNSAEIQAVSPSHSFIIGDVDDYTGRTSMSGVPIAQPTPTQLAPHLPSSQHTDAPGEQHSPRGSFELLGKSTEDMDNDSATKASPDAPVQLDLIQTSPPPPSDQQTGAPSTSHTLQSFSQPQSPSAAIEFSYSPYIPFPEDVTWEEARAEIETFDWGGKGSQ